MSFEQPHNNPEEIIDLTKEDREVHDLRNDENLDKNSKPHYSLDIHKFSRLEADGELMPDEPEDPEIIEGEIIEK
jgi:hypothetical protein